MRSLILVLASMMVITGCAAPSLYQWGGYDSMLYESYKDPVNVEEMKVKLEAHIAEMQKTNQKVAPGLYAELGTLYLQSGDSKKAIEMYSQERDAWPESQRLMSAMIKNLERRNADTEEAAK